MNKKSIKCFTVDNEKLTALQRELLQTNASMVVNEALEFALEHLDEFKYFVQQKLLKEVVKNED